MLAEWTSHWTVLVSLAVALFVYFLGLWNLWRRAGAGRGIPVRHGIRFVGAILALGIALVSPLDRLSEDLFSAHMIQHLIMIFVAAPILVTSGATLAFLWALPRCWAQSLSRGVFHSPLFSRMWDVVSNPVTAWLLFTIIFWVWHASALFEAALRDEQVHALEHIGFLLTAMLFWWVLFRRAGPHHVHYGIAIPYLFLTSLQSTILGALMTFSAQPWYSYYADRVGQWGLSPLQDQQLAGLFMWMPGGFVFAALTIGYFAAWFGALEKRSLVS